MSERLTTQPYKGTRDFYPDQMPLRRWLFDRMRQIVGSYGYQEYDGPMLEPFELYAAKSGEELVNEQLYSFEDRGGRKVAMRPEMTPTLARMVAARGHSLQKPLRWFSIPNLWRYEKPQRGRLREHWQLNVDLLGLADVEAEVEIIQVAIDLMRALGAGTGDFEIQINHRQLMNTLFEDVLQLSPAQTRQVARAIDKRAKITPEAFHQLLSEAGCSPQQQQDLDHFLEAPLLELGKICGHSSGYQDLIRFFDTINALGLGPVCRFNSAVLRGLDYYTGMVFELFDTHPDNRRALFGGGRYDNLVGLFGGQQIPGVGFGMGDVTLVDFLQTHQLLPTLPAPVELLVGLFSAEHLIASQQLARHLRGEGFKVEAILKPLKLGKQFELADKRGIPLVLLQGPDEIAAESVSVKDLQTGQQTHVALADLVDWLRARLV